MKDIYKSAIWSLVSIPITFFGFQASFAIAHGSFLFMIPLLFPGLLALWFLGGNNYPDFVVVIICAIIQYLSYLAFIHGAKMAIRYFK